VDYIETGFYHKQNTLAVFLDIHGALDNINPSRALKILGNWGTPTAIINTLQNYYNNRTIITTLAPTEAQLKIYPTKGTAQGNVLSPMLWNCIVNRIGDMMDSLNIGGCIFADDVIIAARGSDLTQIHSIIQTALNHINAWAEEEGLRFNTGKSHSLLFNSRGKNLPIPPLMLNGKILNHQSTTKYLGVLVDGGLRWHDHLNQAVVRAKRDMVRINNTLSKTFGPSPKLTHWIYTGIIRPKITYAAHVWCGRISNFLLEKRSRQIQRWALTKMGPIRECTPTAGLEIITATTPLHIHLQETSLKTMYNFKTINPTILEAYSPTGHLARWDKMLHEFIPTATLPSDRGPKFPQKNWRAPSRTRKWQFSQMGPKWALTVGVASMYGGGTNPGLDWVTTGKNILCFSLKSELLA
jgi:hypothetical protein